MIVQITKQQNYLRLIFCMAGLIELIGKLPAQSSVVTVVMVSAGCVIAY